MPYLTAGRRSHDPDTCVDAYLDALGLDPEETEHAWQALRHQLVFRSFR